MFIQQYRTREIMWSLILFFGVCSLHWTTGYVIRRGEYDAHIDDSSGIKILTHVRRWNSKKIGNWKQSTHDEKLLDLSGLGIQALAESAFEYAVNVRYLDLTNNKLTIIPRYAFSKMINLENLFLAYNELKTFNVDFTGLNKITYIRLSYNPEVEAAGIKELNLPPSMEIAGKVIAQCKD